MHGNSVQGVCIQRGDYAFCFEHSIAIHAMEYKSNTLVRTVWSSKDVCSRHTEVTHSQIAAKRKRVFDVFWSTLYTDRPSWEKVVQSLDQFVCVVSGYRVATKLCIRDFGACARVLDIAAFT